MSQKSNLKNSLKRVKTMLNKRDNPALFRAALDDLNRQGYKLDTIMTSTLSDEQIAKVTTLNVQPSSMADGKLIGTKGLEQFKTIEHLSIVGQPYYKYARNFKAIYEKQKFIQNYDISSDLAFYQSEYESGQLENQDIEVIYGLENLKSLNLSNQRKISELDLSSLPNLENVTLTNATHLQKLSGLDKNNSIIKGEINYNFDFSGCTALKTVENFDKVVQNIQNARSANSAQIVYLPTVTYASTYRDYAITENKDVLNEITNDPTLNQTFQWTEICEGGVRKNHYTGQMAMATKRCEDIIRTVCKDNPQPDLERISRWYRWICDNITYDDESVAIEEDKANLKSNITREKVVNDTRSSFFTLWNKKGVCVGIRNLFNYGATLMGYTALPLNCMGGEKQANTQTTLNNHAISMMFAGDNAYFFDPTWDLGKAQSEYFMLTKQEMEARAHNFSLESSGLAYGTASFQQALREMGCLKTKDLSAEQAKNN